MASWTVDKATGRVQIRAYAGVDKRTKRKRNLYSSLPAGATEAEILAECERLDAKAAEAKALGFGTDVESLLCRYLDIISAAGRSPSSVQSYRSDLRRHVCSYIGSAPAESVKPWMVDEMFLELSDHGRTDGKPLSQSSRARLYSWLNAAFKWMVGEGHIPSNPMDGCKRVYPSNVEANPISEPDLAKLYRWMVREPEDWDGRVFRKIVWFALNTGMRRGEVSGLQVGDFRYGMRDVKVSRSVTEAGGVHYKKPKSRSSIRSVSLSPGAASDLQSHVHAQADVLETAGIEQGASTPLFCHEDGKLWRPNQLTMRFGELRQDLGLDPAVHFHSMRHTHATLLLASGCDMRTLQERLGHDSATTTLRIYSHVLPGRDQAAAGMWSDIENGISGGA